MSVGHPWWLLLLLAWALVPLLDRLARPTVEAALPVAHLGNRGLWRLPAILPWLSAHGLALLLLILALSEPLWSGSDARQVMPAVAVVAAPGPDEASARLGGKRFDEWLDRSVGREFLLVTADRRNPRLVVPLTERSAYGLGLWPAVPPRPLAGEDVAKAVLMASAKAPEGSWIVVIGGPIGGRGWQAAQAAMTGRKQPLALMSSGPVGPAPLAVPPAFSTTVDDPDGAGALAYQLASVSRDVERSSDPFSLAFPCLIAALVTLVANWLWRHGRWQVVGP
ncbi:MAG: hypothetical protein H7338_03340 [Candidatus Sericytochromatia bacterium]|nr:hypothetical protein [Candidatus Sericytochromatia bacterium]